MAVNPCKPFDCSGPARSWRSYLYACCDTTPDGSSDVCGRRDGPRGQRRRYGSQHTDWSGPVRGCVRSFGHSSCLDSTVTPDVRGVPRGVASPGPHRTCWGAGGAAATSAAGVAALLGCFSVHAVRLGDAMSAPTEGGRARARCVSWLCGQCHGGQACRCVPTPQPKYDQKSPTAPPSGSAETVIESDLVLLRRAAFAAGNLDGAETEGECDARS